MANFYYVSDGATVGSATGDAGRVATTPSTGSFASKGASACYVSIVAAYGATTPPVSGDFILCASDHDHNYGANTTFSIPDGVTVQSVDVSNCENYLAGAREAAETGTGDDITMGGDGDAAVITCKGMKFECNDRFYLAKGSQTVIYEDCSLGAAIDGSTTFGQLLLYSADGGEAILRDCEIQYNQQYASNIIVNKGAKITIINPTFVFNATQSRAMIETYLSTGLVTVENADLSVWTGAASYPVLKMNGLGDDNSTWNIKKCKLPASYPYDTELDCSGGVMDLYSCDTGDGYHYFEYMNFYGISSEDTGIYLTATYDGTNGFSVDIATTGFCSITRPHRYLLATLPNQDLTSNITYEVEFVTTHASSAATLDKSEFWLEIEHPDSADLAQGVITSTRDTDWLGTPASHATSTASWTGLLADFNKYKISQQILAITGASNSEVNIYVCVGKASTDLNVDPAITIT